MIPGAGLLLRFLPQIGAGLAVVALLVGVYQAGVNSERRRGEAAQLRVEIQTLRRDKAIAEAAIARQEQDAAQLEALRRTDGEKIDQLQAIIRSRNDRGLNQLELDGLLTIH